MSANLRLAGGASLDQKLKIAAEDQTSSALLECDGRADASTPLWNAQAPGNKVKLWAHQSGDCADSALLRLLRHRSP